MKRFLLYMLVYAVFTFASGFVQAAVTPGTVTLTASPASGASGITPTLTWSTTANSAGVPAASCVASGGTGFTGSEPTSGSVVLPAQTTTTTYTLTCTWTQSSADLSWTMPTLNTDGTTIAGAELPLTTNVYTGTSPTALTKTVTGLTGTTYVATSLPAGTNYFSVTVSSAQGIESAQSNALSSTNGSATAPASATVTVQETPAAAGGFAVKAAQ